MIEQQLTLRVEEFYADQLCYWDDEKQTDVVFEGSTTEELVLWFSDCPFETRELLDDALNYSLPENADIAIEYSA